jgi:dihydrofolate reductase
LKVISRILPSKPQWPYKFFCMKISIVVAAALDNAIGRNNDLLWKLPADMRFFKNLTWGMPIVMGRKTFESMRSKPLPGRNNIIITRDPSSLGMIEGIVVVSSWDEALEKARDTDCKEVFVIGGGEIYRQVLGETDTIYLTRVEAYYPEADTFFSEIDPAKFSLVDSHEHPADEKHSHSFRFETWERIPS